MCGPPGDRDGGAPGDRETEYERRLDALLDATRRLIAAERPNVIADRASSAAAEILDLRLNGVHLYDEEADALVPVAWSDATVNLVGEPPAFEPDEGLAWRTFERREVAVLDDLADEPDLYNPETSIRSEIQLPLGDHGVFLIGETTAGAFDEMDVTLAKLLASNVEAALDRADRERRLERERDRFAAVFESIPDPAATVSLRDGEAVVESVNSAFERAFEYTESTASGRTLNELIVPEDRQTAGRRIDERAAAGEQVVEEVRRRTAGGELRDFLFRNIPIDGTDEAYGIYTDITDRKRRERTLEALNEVTRRQIRASTPDEVARIAVEAAEEVLGLPLSSVHRYDESEQALELTAVSAAGDSYSEEMDLTYTDHDTIVWEVFESGSSRVVDDLRELPPERIPNPETPARSAVILPLDGHGVFVVTSQTPDAFGDDDIQLAELLAGTTAIALAQTDHEQTLARLHDATRGLMSATETETIAELTIAAARDVLDFSLVSVRSYDPDANVLRPAAATDRALEQFGELEVFERDESLAWRTFDSGEATVLADVTEYEASVNAGTGVRGLMILPLGEYGTLNVAATTPDAFDEADRSLARILAANVETALARSADERELRTRERELSRQNEQLDKFASVVSHDLRNPLNVATGRLELLDSEVESPHIEPIRRSHERMETLIEDVLALAKQGRSVGETSSVSVATTATEAWEQVSGDGTTFEVVTDLVVEADESRLQELFENLFRNSVEHGSTSPRSQGRGGAVEHGRPDEPPQLTIRVGALADDAGFYVADDGAGIPSDEREAVFERGYTTAGEGTGFGLTIVQQIARAHGWQVGVTESEAGGARFEIRLAGHDDRE